MLAYFWTCTALRHTNITSFMFRILLRSTAESVRFICLFIDTYNYKFHSRSSNMYFCILLCVYLTMCYSVIPLLFFLIPLCARLSYHTIQAIYQHTQIFNVSTCLPSYTFLCHLSFFMYMTRPHWIQLPYHKIKIKTHGMPWSLDCLENSWLSPIRFPCFHIFVSVP